MPQRIQLRRGSAVQWEAANPVLEPAEVGRELDTGRIKFGDGVTPWNDLPYFTAQVTPGTLTAAEVIFGPAAGLVSSEVQAAIVELAGKLADEGDARDAADDLLYDALVAEVAGRAAADADLASDIAGGIGAVAANLATETVARLAADSTESAARITADAGVTATLGAAISALATDLGTEETARLAADAALATSVSDLGIALDADVSSVAVNLATETTARTTADATLTAAAAAALQRSNHLGTQPASSISDFAEVSLDIVGASLADTATLDLVYDDAGNAIRGNVLDSPTVAGTTTSQLRDRTGHTGFQDMTTVAGLPSALALKATTADLTTETNARTAADALKADLVGGLVPTSQLPSIVIADYLGDVASQAAMLALVGQRGDWATRSDLGATFIVTAEPSSVLANWKQLTTPADAVSSVNGRTGPVTGLAEQSALIAETTRATAAEASSAQRSANLADLGNATVARSNLGLGSAATQPSSAFDATGAAAAAQAFAIQRANHTGAQPIASVTGLQTALDDKATASALATEVTRASAAEAASAQRSANLADLTDATAARSNLGLGSAAEQPSSVFAMGLQAVAASTVGIATTGTPIIDGYQTAPGDHVLLVGETTASENGSWIVAAGLWSRPSFFATGSVVTGRTVVIGKGTTQAASVWVLTTSPVTVGTTAQTWIRSTSDDVGSVLLPDPLDHVVYVSKGASASDANDGLSAGSAKATPQAAADALPGNYSGSTGGGRIVILHGDYTGGLNITTPRTTVEFIGEGARLVGTGLPSGSAVLRIAASRCKVHGGWITEVPANGVGVLVSVNETPLPPGSTAGTSNQNTELIGIFVDQLGTNAIAYGIGSDTNRDVSETAILGCSSVGNGATSTHIQLGNGAVGNVLDTSNVGGNSQNHRYGVIIAGGSLVSRGLNFQTSAEADVFITVTPVGPVSIEGGRSENAKRFVSSTGVQFATPMAFKDYLVTNLSNTDGKGVLWQSEIPVVFEGVTLNGNTVPQQFFVRQMQGTPGSAIPAIVQYKNCWADHPRPFGPLTERPGYLRVIEGGGQIATASIQPRAGVSANLRRDNVQVQTGAATFVFDAACASTFVVTLDRNCTGVTITHPKVGQVVTLEYRQNGVGGWTYAWPTNVGFAGNAAPTASSTAGDSDAITMRWCGSYWREVARSLAVRPPAPAPVDVADSFAGADDFRPLEITETGQVWQHLLGVVGRAGNKAAPSLLETSLGFSNQDQPFAVAVVDAGRKTGGVEVAIEYQAGQAGLVFSATDDKNFLYVWFDGSVLRTTAWLNGSADTLTTLGSPHVAGVTYTLKVIRTATGFRVYQDGVLVVAELDWTPDLRYKALKDGTMYGLFSSSLVNRFDSFVVDGST